MELAPLQIEPAIRLSASEIPQHQDRLIQSVVMRAWEKVDFYRQRWSEHQIDPESIRSVTDLKKLPIFRKQDIEADLAAHPPFGSLQGNFHCVRLQGSSGSTGKPKPILHTRLDWENITNLWARRLSMQGVTAADRVQVAFNFALFIPSFTSLEGAMKLGALAIPTGSGAVTPSLRQLELARDWGVTVMGTTGGYALHLAAIAQEHGYDLKRDFNIRVMYHTGEPLVEETRRRIEELWGCKSYNNYGSVETGAPAWECVHQNGMHLNEDAYIFEIVDPVTLEPVPDGQEGALVMTSLFKEAAPIIRYMIGDIAAIWSEPCACGCSFRRLSPIRGRIDDMLKIRGTVVYPTAIEAALRTFPMLAPEFRIVVDRTHDGADYLEVQAEVQDLAETSPLVNLIAHAIKQKIGCTAVVTLHAIGSLSGHENVAARTKNRYVVDKRKKL
ncbi:MAG: AMP-binding protein [Zoogloeaceae bacterium]|jgi:phenylacetate-CoA ligase|nr:AMP-binding protein [Zoogloeaceae bacterium]